MLLCSFCAEVTWSATDDGWVVELFWSVKDGIFAEELLSGVTVIGWPYWVLFWTKEVLFFCTRVECSCTTGDDMRLGKLFWDNEDWSSDGEPLKDVRVIGCPKDVFWAREMVFWCLKDATDWSNDDIFWPMEVFWGSKDGIWLKKPWWGVLVVGHGCP